MKQVVGGAFSGLFNLGVEDDIIDTLVRESSQLVEEGLSFSEKQMLLDQCTTRLLVKLKDYLGSRVETYLASIASRLLEPETELKWHYQSNNCQKFCDNLIDRNLFGALLSTPFMVETKTELSDLPDPLYLMSFVCRPGSYVTAKTRSKFDVPNGLTEEYLLKFRYGRHDESDIIDTLAEYWYDWGAFEGPIYPFQDVFPWDCTEGYGRYPGKCGQCNISKHVWAFPFDSWSVTSLHIARGRELYPQKAYPTLTDKGVLACSEQSPASRANIGLMTDFDWFKNRMTILLGQDALLTGAVAMSKSIKFRASTLWLHRQSDERQDRLKLGGIQRAQPFSHHFEKGAYHQYFVADWAHLTRELRIQQYEALRDWKADKADVENGNDDDGGGGGGCGTFACGAVVAGCAAGIQATGHDTCGSGCVSSCSGGGDGDGCGGCGGG